MDRDNCYKVESCGEEYPSTAKVVWLSSNLFESDLTVGDIQNDYRYQTKRRENSTYYIVRIPCGAEMTIARRNHFLNVELLNVTTRKYGNSILSYRLTLQTTTIEKKDI